MLLNEFKNKINDLSQFTKTDLKQEKSNGEKKHLKVINKGPVSNTVNNMINDHSSKRPSPILDNIKHGPEIDASQYSIEKKIALFQSYIDAKQKGELGVDKGSQKNSISKG